MSTSSRTHDPYTDNILVRGLGPILSSDQVLQRLECLPPILPGVADLPRHVRLHELVKLRWLHIPSLEEVRLYQTIDLMLRPALAARDPARPTTWQMLDSGTYVGHRPPDPAVAGFVEGPSGTGKTQAIHRCLGLFPAMIRHERFPMCEGELVQVVSLSVNTPGTGKTADLAIGLAHAWTRLTGSPRFAESLLNRSRRGDVAFDMWCQVAAAAFLGILHIDDVESFFKIPTLQARKNARAKAALPFRELRVAEDQCIKNILHFINSRQIPLILSGTNDGAAALERRLSNAERLAVAGYHRFRPFSGPKDSAFCDAFMPRLGRYQYVRTPVEVDDALMGLIYELTAGVQRIIVALWICAHRVAFERRKTDTLLHSDFKQAAATYMAPVADAVQALLSHDPHRLARYEDLLPRNEGLWASFWSQDA